MFPHKEARLTKSTANGAAPFLSGYLPSYEIYSCVDPIRTLEFASNMK
jgi:hypothetical protein